MTITTATSTTTETGPLLQTVRNFVSAQSAALAKGVKVSSDWDPVAEFVDVDQFERVGAYLEKLNWNDYRQFLTEWAGGGTRFEFTEFHVTEAGDAVFQEIEERHWRDDSFIRKNVIAVYRFSPDGRIRHLDIYEQATDSGQWIIDAARKADANA